MIPRDTALAGASVLIGCGVVVWSLRRRPTWVRLVVVVAALVYGALVVVATFFPLPIQGSLIAYERSAPQESPWVSLVPLDSMVQMLGTTSETALRQIAGNVLLFVPFGFIVPLLGHRRPTLARILLLALAASTAIEGMQLALSVALGFPYRLASIDDVLLNVVGAVVGFLVYLVVRPHLGPVLGASSPGDAG